MNTLAALKPSFRPDGVIHAGNASQISDGASAVLVASPERAAELGLTPIARYHSGAVSGADPLKMLTGPIPATAKVLKRSGLSIGDIGAFEVNEAFAPVPLAWLGELGADPERLNVNGGAIALGHPLGMSGARLALTATEELQRSGGKLALCTMCIGVGQGIAMIIERV